MIIGSCYSRILCGRGKGVASSSLLLSINSVILQSYILLFFNVYHYLLLRVVSCSFAVIFSCKPTSKTFLQETTSLPHGGRVKVCYILPYPYLTCRITVGMVLSLLLLLYVLYDCLRNACCLLSNSTCVVILLIYLKKTGSVFLIVITTNSCMQLSCVFFQLGTSFY